MGCDRSSRTETRGRTVSIHAPRVGCDRAAWRERQAHKRFNSRTPCGVRQILVVALLSSQPFQFTHPVWGATINDRLGCFVIQLFQFTHPVWGATLLERNEQQEMNGFNSRTPCGVRLWRGAQAVRSRVVSIHAPRVGCDSTSTRFDSKRFVSIHAPRVGCDATARGASSQG